MEDFVNEGLTLEILLEKANDYIDGKLTATDFDAWGNTLTVRSYIPITEKVSMIYNIIKEQEYPAIDFNELIVAEMYKKMFFKVYLEGYLGVKDQNEELFTYKNYDILYSVYGAWIESYAKKDIDLFKEMLRESISFNTQVYFSQILNTINLDALKANTDANKDLIEKMEKSEGLMGELKQLEFFNDPRLLGLFDAIKATSANKVKKEE